MGTSYSIVSPKISDIILPKPPGSKELVNYTDAKGNTALHYAVLHAPDCVTLLLANGADIFLTNKKNQRPVDLLKNEPHLETIRRILDTHGKTFATS